MTDNADLGAAGDLGGARVRRRVLLGTAALLVVRLVLTLPRPGPVLLSDEVGYLTNARVLGGGLGADLLGTSFYEGGYSLLIAPLAAIAHDPVVNYRLVLALNAVLAASLFPLLHLLLTRAFGARPDVAVWPAFAAACYPAVTPTAGTAMPENLLSPLTVAWLLAAAMMLGARSDRARIGWAAAVGLCAAALWAVHGRMIVALVLSVALVVLLMLRRRLLPLAAAGCLAMLLCGIVGARLLNEVLATQNYGRHPANELLERAVTFDEPQRWPLHARNFIGQAWYLLVATLGVALVLLVADGRRAVARVVRGRPSTPDMVLALILLSAAGLLVLSALAFGRATRADKLVYGRYAEVVAPPLVALGLAALARGRPLPRPWALAGALLALTGVVAALRAGLHAPEEPVIWNVQSLPFRWLDRLGPDRLLAAGAVAAAAALVLLGVARRRPAAVAPLALLAFLPTAASSHEFLLARSRAVYPAGWASLGSAVDGTGVAAVAYDQDHRVRDGVLTYPWFLRDSVLAPFSGRRDPPPSAHLVSAASWNREHPDRPARAVWKDPARDQTLWKLTVPAPGRVRAVETCLRRARVRATRTSAPGGTPQLVVPLAGGYGGRILFLPTPRAAASRAAQLRRFLQPAVERDRAVILRRGNAIATTPGAVARAERQAFERCL